MLTVAPGLAQSVPDPGSAASQSEPAAAVGEDVESQSDSSISEVLPPVALEVPVAYPAGASGTAVVVLRLVVGMDGLVREPEVIVGDEPFATSAISATASWRFKPAQRGDRAVASKIQFEVRFDQQAVSDLPTEAPTQPATPQAIEPVKSAAVGRADAVIQTSVEAVVEGERPPATVSFSRAEARQVPGAFGDPFRAVEVMPGVAPILSGLPLFYVRGAPPGNVGEYVDEVRVPFLYHVFLGPSVIHPLLIERVSLYQGPYPANIGRVAGAAISADLRAPRRELGYGFSVGMFDAGAYAESPFASQRGNVFAAGRYSYLGALATAVTAQEFQFWNYQLLADYELTRRDNLSVLLFGGFDLFEDVDELAARRFHRADLRWDHSFSPETTSRLAVTLGTDSSDGLGAKVSAQSINARFRLRHRLAESAVLGTGLSFGYEAYDLEQDSRSFDFDQIRTLFPARNDSVAGGYTELHWQPEPAVTMTPALRVDFYKSGEDTSVAVEPRVTARFRVAQETAIVHGVGVAHQPPNYVTQAPGLRVAGLDGGLQRAIHTTSGVEQELPYEVTGSLALFHNVTFEATDPFSASQDLKLRPEEARKRPTARAYGAELSLKRALTRRFGAMLNYTLSRSTRTYDDYQTLSGADRTHVLNVAALYTLGANWRVGGRSVLYSGIPGRRTGGVRLYDQSRAHPFFRTDLQLERRFRIGPETYWSVVAEILNATASTETLRRLCGADGCEDVEVGPVFLPNVRVEGHF